MYLLDIKPNPNHPFITTNNIKFKEFQQKEKDFDSHYWQHLWQTCKKPIFYFFYSKKHSFVSKNGKIKIPPCIAFLILAKVSISSIRNLLGPGSQ